MKAILLSIFILIVVTISHASGERLNDNLSPERTVRAAARWASYSTWIIGGYDELAGLIAEIPGFEVRLDTRDYVGKQARIYLALPIAIDGLKSNNNLRMQWQTERIFKSNSVVQGRKTLIYTGYIKEPVTTEIFDFTLYFDARDVIGTIRFEPIFEIEAF
jgi:hypothetical protein